MTASIDLWSAADTRFIIVVALGAAVAWFVWALYDWGCRMRQDRDEWHALYETAVAQLGETVEDRRRHADEGTVPRTMREARRHQRTVLALAAAAGDGVFDAPTEVLPAWTQPDPNRPSSEPTLWPPTPGTATWALTRDPAPGDDTEPFVVAALTAGGRRG